MTARYNTARFVLGFLEVLGWLTVVAGATFTLLSLGASRVGISGLAFTAPIVCAGLVMVALVQMGRAQIDTAENSAEAVRLLQDGLRHLMDEARTARQAGRNTVPSEANPPPVSLVADREYLTNDEEAYRGERIRRTSSGYVVGRMPFVSSADARAFIDARKDAEKE